MKVFHFFFNCVGILMITRKIMSKVREINFYRNGRGFLFQHSSFRDDQINCFPFEIMIKIFVVRREMGFADRYLQITLLSLISCGKYLRDKL